MIEHARNADPAGSYRLIEDGDFSGFEAGSLDLVFSAFALDNIARKRNSRRPRMYALRRS
jgi:hypothetical protein